MKRKNGNKEKFKKQLVKKYAKLLRQKKYDQFDDDLATDAEDRVVNCTR